MDIKKEHLPDKEYYKEEFEKRIIVLHHTAGRSAQSSIDWWKKDPKRIATSFVIDRDGTILEAFPMKYWASALGISTAHFDKFGLKNINKRLDQISVQIELASWGRIKEEKGKYLTYTGKELKPCDVQSYSPDGYRNSIYFERYTKEQIESLRKLILHINKEYPSIKLDYNEKMWDVSREALVGTWGIWTHTSYRSDKDDCHPQPELIQMLKQLK